MVGVDEKVENPAVDNQDVALEVPEDDLVDLNIH